MFPNIKKVKILTPIISTKTMQSNSNCIQQSSPPPLLLLYTTVINNRKLNGMCLVGISPVYKNKANNEHTG